MEKLEFLYPIDRNVDLYSCYRKQCVCTWAQLLSPVLLFATPWTLACQAT